MLDLLFDARGVLINIGGVVIALVFIIAGIMKLRLKLLNIKTGERMTDLVRITNCFYIENRTEVYRIAQENNLKVLPGGIFKILIGRMPFEKLPDIIDFSIGYIDDYEKIQVISASSQVIDDGSILGAAYISIPVPPYAEDELIYRAWIKQAVFHDKGVIWDNSNKEQDETAAMVYLRQRSS